MLFKLYSAKHGRQSACANVNLFKNYAVTSFVFNFLMAIIRCLECVRPERVSPFHFNNLNQIWSHSLHSPFVYTEKVED